MNDLNFAIGFIVGALFTTVLMFIIKKIFFNFPQFTENNFENQSIKPKKIKQLIKDINQQQPPKEIILESLINFEPKSKEQKRLASDQENQEND
ncbi:MAG: hypothetical protein Q8888_02140 [Vigna little leaf phytoplasma]|nr:hypothetical protein [Vigna little leaf phytoplasma]